ncbi:hypothetical protein ACIXGS_09865 [Bacteroides fragilis]|uniref:Uncharacterized protein n=1 Tax=Bacteroides fragilis TaxID=817 RepID=A0A9Q4NXG0_BACFG|nr:hypothetical protein [Bacteroides fragilis]MCA4539070.1 hypothetical protein [Bacteroides fragilis]MCA4547880.1 hypothetical protein [Bacteroides fragilis]MCA4561326.1 hypothetical protein [Bacteroides fragilis]MCA4580333.1 hypothetical protein [Bacteroides fragilis]MCA4584050.1 hypothetical protein [Bacteroides fragilis]
MTKLSMERQRCKKVMQSAALRRKKSQCPLQGNARSAGVKPSLVRTLPDPLFPSFGASESPTWIPTCFSIRNTLLLSFLCE